MDFVHDPLAMGKKLRVLTVVEAFSRQMCLFWTRRSAAEAKMWWVR